MLSDETSSLPSRNRRGNYEEESMRKKIAVIAVSATLFLGLSIPALAVAEPNGENCVGASASSAPKPGFGPVVSEIANSAPGAVAALIGVIRAAGC